MMNTIAPENGFQAARNALSDPKSSDEIICAACEVLAESNNWNDIRLVSENRNLLWAQPGSDISTACSDSLWADYHDRTQGFDALPTWICVAASVFGVAVLMAFGIYGGIR